MIRFGVAGNCDRFYEEGFKQSVQAPEWLSAQGLTAYIFTFGPKKTFSPRVIPPRPKNVQHC